MIAWPLLDIYVCVCTYICIYIVALFIFVWQVCGAFARVRLSALMVGRAGDARVRCAGIRARVYRVYAYYALGIVGRVGVWLEWAHGSARVCAFCCGWVRGVARNAY